MYVSFWKFNKLFLKKAIITFSAVVLMSLSVLTHCDIQFLYLYVHVE